MSLSVAALDSLTCICARGLLVEATEIAAFHPVYRFCFFSCLGLGFDADVRELCRLFLHIKTGSANSLMH